MRQNACLMVYCVIPIFMSTPVGGGHIIFAFSGVCRPTSGRLVSAHLKEKYLSYLYQIWYGCLLG